MTRLAYIEQIRRMIYGSVPSDDAEITINLVNQWLDQAIAYAAKLNYTDTLKLDGIAYVNNSFYTTYSSIAVTKDGLNQWKIQLPHIPFGLGTSEGVSTIMFKDSDSNQVSYPLVWLSMNQMSYQRGMRAIPNKFLAYSEGEFIKILSTLTLSGYTANVTMVSGGDSTNLNSTLNIPADYLPAMTDYLKQQLAFSRMQPVDEKADGIDSVRNV